MVANNERNENEKKDLHTRVVQAEQDRNTEQEKVMQLENEIRAFQKGMIEVLALMKGYKSVKIKDNEEIQHLKEKLESGEAARAKDKEGIEWLKVKLESSEDELEDVRSGNWELEEKCKKLGDDHTKKLYRIFFRKALEMLKKALEMLSFRLLTLKGLVGCY